MQQYPVISFSISCREKSQSLDSVSCCDVSGLDGGVLVELSPGLLLISPAACLRTVGSGGCSLQVSSPSLVVVLLSVT